MDMVLINKYMYNGLAFLSLIVFIGMTIAVIVAYWRKVLEWLRILICSTLVVVIVFSAVYGIGWFLVNVLNLSF